MNDLFVLLGLSSWKPFLGAVLLPPLPFIAMMLVGFAIYKLLIGPMIGKPNWDTNTFIATSGLALALESLALLVFGPRNQARAR